MAWNGSGSFLRAYNWQADRDASIKIMAARMDGEFNNYQGGLNNCLTLDGQNSPTADISWNSHKITNLATPTNPADAVTKAYVDTGGAVSLTTGTFLSYGSSFTWISATSFKVLGVDATALLTPGRRVKITHNTGATVSYATVVSSSFSTDTTVVVVVDAGAALVTTVTALAIGLEPANNNALPQKTAIQISSGFTTVPTGAASYTALTGLNVSNDTYSEFNTGTATFTAARRGLYRVFMQNTLRRNGATVAAGQITRGAFGTTLGTSIASPACYNTDIEVPSATFTQLTSAASSLVTVSAAGTLVFYTGYPSAFTYTGGPIQMLSYFTIEAVLYY